MPQTPKPKNDPYADIAEDPYAGIAEGATPPPAAPAEKPYPSSVYTPFDEEAWYRSQPAPVRAMSAFESGYGIPRSVQRTGGLQEAGQGLKLAALHPGLELDSLRSMWDSMSQAQQDLLGRSAAAYGQPGVGNKFYGFALGIYSMIPVMGPAIVDALESFQKGDKAGGVGKMSALLTQVAHPGETKVGPELRGSVPTGEPGAPATLGTLPSPPRATGERALTVARRFTGVRPEVKEAVTKAAEDRPKELEARRGRAEATIRKNIEEARKERMEFEQQKQKLTQEDRVKREAIIRKNEAEAHAALAKFERQKLEVAEENRAKEARNQTQQQQVLRHRALEQEMDTESVALKNDAKNLEHQVWQEANRRMDASKPVGNPTSDSANLISKVKDVRKNVLQDIPENVKEFNRILGMEPTEDLQRSYQSRKEIMDAHGMTGEYEELTPVQKALIDREVELDKQVRPDLWGGAVTAGEPLTWEKLQALKTRLDARLRSGNMNSALQRAVSQVQDSVVDEMGNLLQQSGGNVQDWESARDFYREWKEDFHEPTGPRKSGSPVAQSLQAVDPAEIRKPFSGTTQSTLGNRGVNTLRKYAQWGGNAVADRVEGILARQGEQDLLPSEYKPEKPTPTPEVLQLPTRKPAGPAPLPEVLQLRERQPAEPIPERPVVDLEQESRRAIAKRAKSWGQFNARDIGILSSSIVGGLIGHMLNLTGVTHGASSLIPVAALTYEMGKYFASGALDKARVVDWLARTPQAELNALARIPGVDGVNVRNGLTEVALEAGRQGKISVSQQFRSFIGSKNVQRLVSAGAIAGAATKARSPGQQIRDLRKIQEKFSDNPHMPIGPGQ